MFFEQNLELRILVRPAPLPPTAAAGIQPKSAQLQLYTVEAASVQLLPCLYILTVKESSNLLNDEYAAHIQERVMDYRLASPILPCPTP